MTFANTARASLLFGHAPQGFHGDESTSLSLGDTVAADASFLLGETLGRVGRTIGEARMSARAI